MKEKYIAHYTVTDASGGIIHQGQTEINKTGEVDPDSEEGKESAANAVFWSLSVQVNKLEKP